MAEQLHLATYSLADSPCYQTFGYGNPIQSTASSAALAAKVGIIADPLSRVMLNGGPEL